MIKATYQAAICGSAGAYGAVFPDLLGCTSAGDTIDVTTEMAHEALELHLLGMIEDSEPLPEPLRRALADVAREFGDPDGPVDITWVRMIDVTVQVPDATDTIPIRVKADLVQRVAALAASTSSTIVEHEIERYRKSAA